MKKMLAMLAALVLTLCACACAEAPEEAVIDRFSDVWVDDGIAVEIWYGEDDSAFHCSAVLGDGDDENDVWEYEACRYDAEKDALICEGGVHTHETYDESAQSTTSEVVSEGLTAEFGFRDGEDALIWKESEGVAKDFVLRRLTDAESDDYAQAQAYVGRWGCDRATIDIADNEDGSYAVDITWGNSAAEASEWHYTCLYDANAHRLYNVEPGTRAEVTYAENGDVASTEVVYEDGEATFAIEDDGRLIWNDMKENAAEGMRFEAAIEIPEEVEGNVIYPMFDRLDMNEGTYRVHFDSEDVADGEIANVEFYTVDCYDIVDMSLLKAGDGLCIEGEIVPVESVGEDEYGKLVNGGYDEGGYTLMAFDEENCFKSVGDDDVNTYTQRAVATVKLAENVTFTDGWDIDKGTETFTGIEAVTKAIAESEYEFFDADNAEIRLEGGEVVEIIRYYTP